MGSCEPVPSAPLATARWRVVPFIESGVSPGRSTHKTELSASVILHVETPFMPSPDEAARRGIC